VRVLVIVLLLCAQGWSLVAFGASGYEGERYPQTEDITRSPNDFVGDKVFVYGQVIATDPVVISADHHGREHRLTITNLERDPTEDQYLGVHGTLVEPGTVEAIGSVVRGSTDHVYTYAVSALAGLWVLLRFVRDWRPSLRELAFVPVDVGANSLSDTGKRSDD
jgi:hypothetical protein